MFGYKIYTIKALKKCFSEDNNIRPSRTFSKCISENCFVILDIFIDKSNDCKRTFHSYHLHKP